MKLLKRMNTAPKTIEALNFITEQTGISFRIGPREQQIRTAVATVNGLELTVSFHIKSSRTSEELLSFDIYCPEECKTVAALDFDLTHEAAGSSFSFLPKQIVTLIKETC